ncbi:MAG: FprA family A-type flavoprotein, partial [Niameybacter sp.]
MAKHLNVTNALSWVGACDPHLRIFDIVMETEFGTTYNAYVLKGSEKTAVFETVKAK